MKRPARISEIHGVGKMDKSLNPSMKPLTSLAASAIWVTLGAWWLFFTSGESLKVDAVVSAPNNYRGRIVTLSGDLYLGNEASMIFPSGAERRRSPVSSGIALDFSGSLESLLESYPTKGESVVRGILEVAPDMRAKCRGLYLFRLNDARIVQWPPEIRWLLFLSVFISPPLLLLSIHFYMTRAPAPANGVHHRGSLGK